MTSLVVLKKENYLVQRNDQLNKTLVNMSIEKSLLEIGKETYDKVVHDLYMIYHSYLSDCYEHPEYLCNILVKLYGDTGKSVADSIKKQLEEFSDHDRIAELLKVIHRSR